MKKRIFRAAGMMVTVFILLNTSANAGTNYWFYEGYHSAVTSGATLSCYVYSKSTDCPYCSGNDTIGTWCKTSDTRVDGHGVYAKFQMDGYPEARYNGVSPDWIWRQWTAPDSYINFAITGCRDRGTFGSDNCGTSIIRIYPN